MSSIRDFFSFQRSTMVSKGFIKCAPFLLLACKGSLMKASKRSKNVHLELSTAFGGLIQVFLVVS